MPHTATTESVASSTSSLKEEGLYVWRPSAFRFNRGSSPAAANPLPLPLGSKLAAELLTIRWPLLHCIPAGLPVGQVLTHPGARAVLDEGAHSGR